ncbi:MAG TPA: pyrroline-5-carboxylate reductase [Steroidobacteraceae bacterium]|nr:pyrroline-5-carboxylate reductase [Steroidobacteraceae bacterium]
MSKRAAGAIGVIGAGVVGRALIKGMLNAGAVSRSGIWAVTRSSASADHAAKDTGVTVHASLRKARASIEIAETILLCVKPKDVVAVARELRELGLPPKALVISTAAGVSLATLEKALPGVAVVRAMPNTPCVIREGITTICGGARAGLGHVKRTRAVFESVGRCVELQETHFDAVTGLSGSGPAYLYLVMEALADGGVRVGLPRDIALELVVQVARGAAEMVRQTGRHPAHLRDDVTTPAGCTIGGLLILEDGKIRSVLARAVEEATRIAKGLGI